jgi:hypothetical protein
MTSSSVMDASAKGRMHPGERNGIAKLNEPAVRTIRAEWTGKRGQLASLARRFDVSAGAIRFVVRRETWKLVV